MQGLWVIPTPIGNLADITLRALETLREVDVLWCEDTRQSRKLLHHYRVPAKELRSLHAANEHRVVHRLFAEAQRHNWKVGLMTDAGTPGVSDPGYLPVQVAIQRNIPVYVLPGPTAFLVALIASGLPSNCFVFEGFFPRKSQNRYVESLLEEERTYIWYESPRRLVSTLALLKERLGDYRMACVARELTKVHEEVRRGTLAELYAHYTAHPPRGEVVLLLAGASYAVSL
ncbi:MAG: 16S rRNA (cytidine(1402)-2'-O)-methyltransferase [Bacteroidia bacterium]|nr:16S rRNA (cytidine(1402)-2'-O)-methyltransferase [Bacteroidia bacterium]